MLKPIRTTIIGGEHLPDTRRDPCRRDRPGSEDRRRDRQAGRGRLAREHGRRGGGRPRVGDRVAVADLLHRGAACPACDRPEGRRRARSQRALQGSCQRTAQDQDPEHAERRRYRGNVRRRRAAGRRSEHHFDGLGRIAFEIERWRRQGRSPSCRARPIPGQARSASRRRTATPLICPWRPSPVS